MNELKKYKLKPEFQTLFGNLAKGDEFMLKAAFDVPGAVNTKGYATEEAGQRDLRIMDALVKAGFVEEIGTGVTYVPKP